MPPRLARRFQPLLRPRAGRTLSRELRAGRKAARFSGSPEPLRGTYSLSVHYYRRYTRQDWSHRKTAPTHLDR